MRFAGGGIQWEGFDTRGPRECCSLPTVVAATATESHFVASDCSVLPLPRELLDQQENPVSTGAKLDVYRSTTLDSAEHSGRGASEGSIAEAGASVIILGTIEQTEVKVLISRNGR